jgi:hypothetical protein
MSDDDTEDSDQVDWAEFLRTEAPVRAMHAEKRDKRMAWIKGLRVKKPKQPQHVKKEG